MNIFARTEKKLHVGEVESENKFLKPPSFSQFVDNVHLKRFGS